VAIDEIDHEILKLLRQDALMPRDEMARKVGIAPRTLKRRIADLRGGDSQVIRRFTIAVDHAKLGPSVDAFIEVAFKGDADIFECAEVAIELDGVRDAMVVTGGQYDLLLRVRGASVYDVGRLVVDLRAALVKHKFPPSETRTRFLVYRKWHADEDVKKDNL
jgi:Lrp/AsnC family leucine-responsive transcriptional regulator